MPPLGSNSTAVTALNWSTIDSDGVCSIYTRRDKNRIGSGLPPISPSTAHPHKVYIRHRPSPILPFAARSTLSPPPIALPHFPGEANQTVNFSGLHISVLNWPKDMNNIVLKSWVMPEWSAQPSIYMEERTRTEAPVPPPTPETALSLI